MPRKRKSAWTKRVFAQLIALAQGVEIEQDRLNTPPSSASPRRPASTRRTAARGTRVAVSR